MGEAGQKMADDLNWYDVFALHRGIKALYFEGGKIKSLMFSLDRRRLRLNEVHGDQLLFYFPDDFEYDLLEKVKEGEPFIVYRKISPDRWQNAGLYKVKSIGQGIDSLKRPSFILTVIPYKK